MAAKHFSPTHKDSLTVHRANSAKGTAIKKSLITQQRGLPPMSVGKKFFTTADQQLVHDPGKIAATNVAGILET